MVGVIEGSYPATVSLALGIACMYCRSLYIVLLSALSYPIPTQAKILQSGLDVQMRIPDPLVQVCP